MISNDFTPVNKFKSTSLTCVLIDSVIIKIKGKFYLRRNLKHVLEIFSKSKNSGIIFNVKMNFYNFVGILFCNCGDTKTPLINPLATAPLDPRTARSEIQVGSSVLFHICTIQR